MTNAPKIESVRLNPSIFNSRRFCLVQLRKEINLIITKFIEGRDYNELLDYGCGDVPYKPLFKIHFKNYIGADISDSATSNLRLNKDGTIPLKSDFVDVVLSTQVLEHVEYPTVYLHEALRVLKKDGLFIISTHGYWIFHPDPNDFWRWTSQGLKKIVEEAGFEIISFRGILGRSAIGLQLFQDGFIFKLPLILKQIFSLIMQLLIWFFDKTSSQKTKDKDAGIFIIVARKK
jgi:SAM-dependent methyltransferase